MKIESCTIYYNQKPDFSQICIIKDDDTIGYINRCNEENNPLSKYADIEFQQESIGSRNIITLTRFNIKDEYLNKLFFICLNTTDEDYELDIHILFDMSKKDRDIIRKLIVDDIHENFLSDTNHLTYRFICHEEWSPYEEENKLNSKEESTND